MGAGTGAEVRHLAPIFPGWPFTMVDPSEAMPADARRQAHAEGFADRCNFHVGFVSTLPTEAHDAATSLLVSHLLTDAGARQSYIQDIAARLKPGGILVNADLAADVEAPAFEPVMALWLDLRDLGTAMPPDARARFRAAFGRDVAAHGPAGVEGAHRARLLHGPGAGLPGRADPGLGRDAALTAG